MKIKFPKNYKSIFTIEDMEIVKKEIIPTFADVDIKDYAQMAISCAGEAIYGYAYTEKIYEATAEATKNRRIYNLITEKSNDMDVFIEVTALTSEGFLIVGAYISDLFGICADNKKEIARHFFIRRFDKIHP